MRSKERKGAREGATRLVAVAAIGLSCVHRVALKRVLAACCMWRRRRCSLLLHLTDDCDDNTERDTINQAGNDGESLS